MTRYLAKALVWINNNRILRTRLSVMLPQLSGDITGNDTTYRDEFGRREWMQNVSLYMIFLAHLTLMTHALFSSHTS